MRALPPAARAPPQASHPGRIRLFSSPSRHGCRVVHDSGRHLSCRRRTNPENTPNLPVTHGSDPRSAHRQGDSGGGPLGPDGPRFSRVDSPREMVYTSLHSAYEAPKDLPWSCRKASRIGKKTEDGRVVRVKWRLAAASPAD